MIYPDWEWIECMADHTYNTADAILAQLAAAGVKRVYGVVGDAVFPLADAFTRQSSVQFVATAHEGAAAFMASYEAKLTSQLTACLATSGPGAANLAIGLADAYFDAAPVIAITGQVDTGKIGTQAHQFFNQQGFFGSICASSTMAVSPSAALAALVISICRSITQQTATHLSVAKDVLSMPVAWTPLPIKLQSQYEQSVRPTPADIDIGTPTLPCTVQIGDIEAACSAMVSSRHPLILLGTTASPDVTAALRLAELLGAAVVPAQHTKGAVPSSHPLVIGSISPAHIPDLVNQLDLVILVGDAPYELPLLPQEARLVAVTERTLLPPKLPLLAELQGQTAATLHWLCGKLAGHRGDPAWLQGITAAKSDLVAHGGQMPPSEGNSAIHPYQLALTLSEALAPDAVVAIDIGAFSHWFNCAFKVRNQTILTSERWRGMGLGLPAAIAAKLAYPQRQAVALVGDGAWLMSLGELATAIRLQLPILIIIADNGGYDLETQKMLAEGLTPFGTELQLQDMAPLAASWGAIGYQIASDENGHNLQGIVRRALQEAEERRRPALLHIRCSGAPLPHIMKNG